MPSNKAESYHWTLRTALAHFITEVILSHKYCIVTDQEYHMYQPARSMMYNVPYVPKSLYQHTQKWKKNIRLYMSVVVTTFELNLIETNRLQIK